MHGTRHGGRIVGFALLLVGLAAVGVRAEEEAEGAGSAAAALLAEAESLAARGRYDAAVAAYRKLAREHPDTEPGRVGKRRSEETAYLGWAPILRHGPSENRIDIVVMGDGYRLEDQKKFDKTAAAVPKLFKRHHVMGAYFAYHNFHRMNLRSKDCHVDAHGREFDTALDAKGAGSQGQVEIDTGRARAFLEHHPEAEGLCIVFVQRGQLGTGGSGVATVGGRADTTLMHEWGHAFGGLGDEYAIGQGAGGYRDAPNVSETDDEALVPWKHWIEARVPGVGVYEGALGQARGAWKPTNRCAMEKGTDFCPICREVLVLRIYEIVDPIDGCAPEPRDRADEGAIALLAPARFEVRVMEPARHALVASWWVLPESAVPPDPEPLSESFGAGDRRRRGPLAPIAAKPLRVSKKARKGVHELELDPAGLTPGRWRVVCRVEDPVRGRGDRWPWVLKDEHGLLVSERAWWVEVK